MPVDFTTPDPIQKTANSILEFLIEQTNEDSITRAHSRLTDTNLYLDLEGAKQHSFNLYRVSEAVEEEVRKDSTFTVRELMEQNLPPRKALIAGMLHAGETIAIVGRQKVGKSRLVQQMALSLANAEPFLGMQIGSPARTLMIDLENGRQSLSKRFRDMNGATGGHELIHVWCADSLASPFPDVSTEGAARLRALIERVQPDVLIIDPWRLWLAGGDENDARDITKALKVLASLRQVRKDLAIVVVHHLRKERYENTKKLLEDAALWVDAVSGHHALAGHTDAVYGLERQTDEDGNWLIIFGGIARSVEPPTLMLDEDDSLRFSVAMGQSAARQLLTPAEQKILDSALNLPPFTFTQLLNTADTKNRKAASRVLRIAVAHGLMTKKDRLHIVVKAADAADG